mmetsp:Transcript_44487/g.144417  ORF Transcript_44487/g.144417 Transcript_44487/m.144417 type:complete len:338 (-) Transcript_44487:340-1353(-)
MADGADSAPADEVAPLLRRIETTAAVAVAAGATQQQLASAQAAATSLHARLVSLAAARAEALARLRTAHAEACTEASSFPPAERTAVRAALRAALALGADEDAVRFAQSWLEMCDAAEAASEARAQLSAALLAAREALRAAAARGHPLRDLACLAPLAAARDDAVAASLPAAEVAAAEATLRELEEASAIFDAEAAEARLALEGSSRSGDPSQIEAALRRAEPVKSAVIVEHAAALSTLSALRVQAERSAATLGLSSATADAAAATAEPDSESGPSAVNALRALETALARAAAAGVSGLAVHRAQSQRALMSGAAEALRREEDALSWIRESIQAGRA